MCNQGAVKFGKNIAACLVLIVVSVLIPAFGVAQTLPDAPSAQKSKKSAAAAPSDKGWPRTVISGADKFTVYQPQVEKWDGNRVYFYAAVELQAGAKTPLSYGVIWFNARAEVDKVNRMVTLDQVQLTKVNFPVTPSKNAELSKALEPKLPNATKTVSLDRLLAATEADSEPVKGVEVKNDPPKIIFSPKESVLVLVDGPPKLSEIQGTKLQRVINTRAILLFEERQEDLLPAGHGLVAAGRGARRAMDLCQEAA